MAWICPLCKRQFKNRNQSHSCLMEIPEDHFLDKAPRVKAIYDKLLKEVNKLGPVNVSPVKIKLKPSNHFFRFLA